MGEIEQLDALAERINAEHRACEEAVGTALGHAIGAGELLTQAKASVPHGSWGSWLAENFAGSDRTARAYMRVYSRRDELEVKRQSSATLSLDGALKALSAPKEDEPPRPVTFEDGTEATRKFVEIRESGAWRRSGHASFGDYLRTRWGGRGVTPEILQSWEDLAKDPPRSLRGAPIGKITELAERLRELETLPSKDPGLAACGRALMEIEEDELYKLTGYHTFSRYCRERLKLSRNWKEALFLYADLDEAIPGFASSKFPYHIPEDTPREDFERAFKILMEIDKLVGVPEEE